MGPQGEDRRSQLELAYTAAFQCAYMADEVVEIADPTEGAPRLREADRQPTFNDAFEALCHTLEQGREHILTVSLTLLAAADGPTEDAGFCAGCAHEFAFDYACRVWEWGIHGLPDSEAKVHRAKYLRIPGAYLFDSEAIARNGPAIMSKLSGFPKIEAGKLKAIIRQEHARAMLGIHPSRNDGPTGRPFDPRDGWRTATGPQIYDAWGISGGKLKDIGRRAVRAGVAVDFEEIDGILYIRPAGEARLKELDDAIGASIKRRTQKGKGPPTD